MKKLLFFASVCFSLFTFAAEFNPALESARALAADGVIVDQSSIASQYRTNTSLEIQETSLYRLNDTLARQEALKIALSLRGVDVPPSYYCRGYFADIYEDWVCRVVEFAADYSIVTRANSRFRPHDSLTLAESLKILMVSLQIPLTNTDAQIISGNLPEWQKHIVLTLREKNISFFLYDNYGREVASFYGSDIFSAPIKINMSHRMTRGEFFQLVTALRDKRDSNSCYSYRYSTCPSSCQSVCTSSSGNNNGGIGTADCEGPNSCIPKDDTDPLAHCTVYNDGCNDCTTTYGGGAACTKRACFWKGIPSCSACEVGYSLENGRCVYSGVRSCVQEGQYAGGGFVAYPENMADFQCCAGLTRAERKDGSTLADAGYTCIRQGDNVCDSRYESEYNSSDCRLVAGGFDSSICLGYFDGCNSCNNDSNGNAACTLRYCFVNGPAYCTSYIPYVPRSQSQDTLFLGKVVSEMRNYTKDLSCTTSEQCKWSMVGYKACGGPTAAIAYSTKNVQQSLIDSKGKYITDAEKYFNQYYNVMSDCMYVQPPRDLSCVNGYCQ